MHTVHVAGLDEEELRQSDRQSVNSHYEPNVAWHSGAITKTRAYTPLPFKTQTQAALKVRSRGLVNRKSGAKHFANSSQ